MASTPQFASSPKVGIGSLSSSNTNLNGSGTLVTVFSAGASGSKINEVVVQATGTVTAGIVRIFVHDGTSGYLFDEFPITATIPSSSSSAFRLNRIYDNLVIPTGYSLRATTANAETFNVLVWGADL